MAKKVKFIRKHGRIIPISVSVGAAAAGTVAAAGKISKTLFGAEHRAVKKAAESRSKLFSMKATNIGSPSFIRDPFSKKAIGTVKRTLKVSRFKSRAFSQLGRLFGKIALR